MSRESGWTALPTYTGNTGGEHTGVCFLTAKSVACLALGVLSASLNHGPELPRPKLICKLVSGTLLSTAGLKQKKTEQ